MRLWIRSEGTLQNLRQKYVLYWRPHHDGPFLQCASTSDGVGTITLSELRTLLRAVLGKAAPSEDQLKETIKNIDTNKSGNIDFGEFLDLISGGKHNISVAELREAFSKIGKFLVYSPSISQSHPMVHGPF